MNHRVVLLAVCVGLLLVGAASAAWYNSDWNYRKEFTVHNTGSALTDYQIMFTVNRSAGSDSGTTVYLNEKCESDYDDIRFTKSDGSTLLDYWIESSSSSTATIWVEVDSIAGSGDTTLYLYYGNSGAPAVSNGTNTFPFFDDFPGSSLDGSKWTVVSGSALVGSSIVTLGSGDIRGNSVFGTNYAIRYNASQSSSGSTSYSCGGGFVNDAGNHYALIGGNGFTAGENTPAQADGAAVWTTGIGGLNSYCIYDILRNGSTSCKYYRDGANFKEISTHVSTQNLKTILYGNSNAIEYCDWILVRKYTATEPTVSAWGSEEMGKVINIYPNFSGVPTSGYVPLTVYFTNSSTSENCTINTWQWSFGDSTANSTQQNPAHTYTTSGLYNVILTITNTSFSLTNSTQKTGYINVTINPNAPVADFTVTETCGDVGDTFYFIDFSTGGGLYAWNWSFGDGSYSELRNPTHQYATNGTYDVNLSVWGAYGNDSLLRENLITIPCGAPTPTPTPTLTPGYTGSIPNKPIITGTSTPTPTENISNWTWIKTGGLIGNIANELLPEFVSSFGSFIPFLVIIVAIGFLVMFVEGWIRMMR